MTDLVSLLLAGKGQRGGASHGTRKTRSIRKDVRCRRNISARWEHDYHHNKNNLPGNMNVNVTGVSR